MVIKAVQGMINVAIANKVKADKNVKIVAGNGQKLVSKAELKAGRANVDAHLKAERADEGISGVIEKITTMSDSLKTKAAKLDAIAASVRK